MKISLLLLSVCLSLASAWVVPPQLTSHTFGRTSPLPMALDYNDPIVAEEFNNVQPMTFEECEEELLQSGVRVGAAMNDMEVKLMLVELRLQLSGKLNGGKKKERPTTFSNAFEEALYTKPAFEAFYNELKLKDDHNSMNVVSEYINDPTNAEARYGKDYRGLLRKLNAALNAPPPVDTPTLQFTGFPANMGEMGCKMTLEALGAISDFECSETPDSMYLTGKVTYEDIESAKKAVAQYNGMDMGMGTALELISV